MVNIAGHVVDSINELTSRLKIISCHADDVSLSIGLRITLSIGLRITGRLVQIKWGDLKSIKFDVQVSVNQLFRLDYLAHPTPYE